jgi:hypothetical protein
MHRSEDVNPHGAPVDIAKFFEFYRSKDLLGSFEAFYRARHEEDPESWPLTLYSREWFGALGEYLQDLDPDASK